MGILGGCMTVKLSRTEYEKSFDISGEGLTVRHENALKHALEIRRFEIELYWKRATYFWTFIAGAFAAYGVIQGVGDPTQKVHLSVLVGVLGFVFSFAWQAVNRGSKKWQENWENHVALLEDKAIGPLYKTVIGRPPVDGFSIEHLLTGPESYSVSKINQIISIFVTVIWLILVYFALPSFGGSPDPFLIIVISLGGLACIAIAVYGRTDTRGHTLEVEYFDSKINDSSR